MSDRIFNLLSSTTAATNAPTLATDGVAIGITDAATVFTRATASGGTLEVTLRLWGYFPDTTDETLMGNGWFPLSTGSGTTTSNTSGIMNGGVKFEAIASNLILGYERIDSLWPFTRLYAQVVSISGTSAAVGCELYLLQSAQRNAV